LKDKKGDNYFIMKGDFCKTLEGVDGVGTRGG